MTYDVGFLMEQNAGHLTNYRNMRTVIDRQTSLDVAAWWEELHYLRPGGRIERLQSRFPSFVPTYLTGNARMALEFRAALQKRRYDAMLTNSWAVRLFGRRMASIPTMIDFDSTPRQIDRMAAYGSPHDPPGVAAVKYKLCRRAYASARVLQAWSTWAKHSAVTEYGIPEDKVIVNPPGVDLEFFRPLSGKQDGRPLRILFVGRDFRRKGGELLLEWFRHRTAADVELHIATRDPVARTAGLVVHSNIPEDSLRLRQLYQTSDIFALPSLAECLGVATIEAMAAGLPVIVSDVGGTADLVEDGVNGFIVRAGRMDSLAAALTVALSDAGRRCEMGKRSRRRAEQRFNVRTNALRTLTVLRDLAAGTSPISRLNTVAG